MKSECLPSDSGIISKNIHTVMYVLQMDKKRTCIRILPGICLLLLLGRLTIQPAFSVSGEMPHIHHPPLRISETALLPIGRLDYWIVLSPPISEKYPADQSNRTGELVIVGPNASNPLTPMLEGESQTFTVALSEVPTGNVEVTFSSETKELSFTPESPLTFTTTNFSAPQTITVTATDNLITDAHRLFSVNFSATGGEYSTTKQIKIYVNNNDKGQLVVDPMTIDPVNEENPVTFKVKLSLEPVADVTVKLSPVDGLNLEPPGPLTFTKTTWNDAQTVTVTVVPNTVDDKSSKWLRINMVSSGGGYVDDSFVDLHVYGGEKERETVKRDLVIVESNANVPIEEGESKTFTVALSSEPTDEVAVTLTPDAGLTVNQAKLTFTPENYNTPQTVAVTATDNQVVLGRQIRLLVLLSSSGGEYTATHQIDILVNENDSGELVVAPTEVDPAYEGDSFTFTVNLNLEPADDVIVTLTPGTGLNLDQPGPLTFTPANYSTPKTITVHVTGTGPGWLRVDVSTEQPGWNQGLVSVYVSDEPKEEGEEEKDQEDILTEVSIDGPRASNNETPIIEGESQTFTVALPTVPTGNVLVTLTPDTGIELDLTELTFTQVNFYLAQEITLTVTENLVTNGNRLLRIGMSLSGGGYSATKSILVYVEENDRGRLLVNPMNSLRNAIEGTSVTFTVTLELEPSDDVTISIKKEMDGIYHPSITLELAPTTLTFTPENWQTAQEVLITVVDNNTNDDNGWQRLNLSCSGGGYSQVSSKLDVFLLDNDQPVAIESEALPETFIVTGNYPNPFTDMTRLTFDLPWPAHVRMDVLDVTGRRLLTIPDIQVNAGWAKTIELENPSLPAGFYLYRLIAGSSSGVSTQTGRFVIIR